MPPKPVVYDRSKFYTLIQTENPAKADYDRYAGIVGRTAASYMLGILFERAVRMKGPDQTWSGGAAPNRGLPVTPASAVSLKPTDKVAFLNYNATMLMGDHMKMQQRGGYVTTLLGRARNGELRVELANGNIEPEANYYTAPPPTVPKPGAPPIPPKPPAMVNQSKAIRWVTRGVHGDSSAFVNAIQTNVTPGQYPLKNDGMVAGIWTELTRGDGTIPPWRDMNPAVPYPSSIGGRHMLKTLLGTTLAAQAFPAAGDPQWQDWALFTMGAMMTMQAFPDANKRISRVCYALVMLSGGIPFVAPTDAYGSRLAAMM